MNAGKMQKKLIADAELSLVSALGPVLPLI